jgi:CRP-like cAMP-binding protein
MESGWAYTYRLLKDGSRQVINFHLPGDFVALSHVILRYWEGGAVALTDIEVWEISPNDISDIVQSRPRLATALLWAISREGALAEEHLVDLGRRTALVRTAHFLLELGTRLKHIGLATDAGYACPINQSLLADAVGISPIHLNRVLRQLRESGCLTFRNGYVSLDHPQRLIALAQYDGSYLEQPAQPLLL